MFEVADINLTKPMSCDALVRQMKNSGGFTGRLLAEAVDILEQMVKDKRCIKFLSFPAAPIATGLRGVIRELIKRRLVDIIITTCGTLDHDLARCWGTYFHGSFNLDDRTLYKKGYHRLGNLLIPKEAYGPLLEKHLQPIFEKILGENTKITSSLLASKLGEYIRNESSILYWCWRSGVKVFIPGLTDGAVGSQLWLYWQKHRNISIDPLGDEEKLAEIVFKAKRSGALMLGGGISKHHTLWWNQFRGGLDYAVYITTAVEYDGSLSGAEVREAISWGKVSMKAKQVTVHGDATALLPLIVAALIERI
ncbi:MAG: deoxyhypusine synthase [Nitrososphaerales archaeon]